MTTSGQQAMASSTADTVATLLREPETRADTVDALEAHIGAHEEALALAAMAELSDLMTLGVSEVDASMFQRIGWLRGRLVAEAADQPAMYAAAMGNGRAEAIMNSSVNVNVIAQVAGKAADELSCEDVLSYACVLAVDPPALARGTSAPWNAACGSALEYIKRFITSNMLGL